MHVAIGQKKILPTKSLMSIITRINNTNCFVSIIFSPVMMAKRPDVDTMHSSCAQHRQPKINKKSVRHTDYTTLRRIDIKGSETTLSPNDELECRQMYEKLQRLQPNGVCVDLNTLRRALYPPSALPKTINGQILAFKAYRQR
jgi:hypothetical protein